eukprot:6492355-Amphidinium_carterae.1
MGTSFLQPQPPAGKISATLEKWAPTLYKSLLDLRTSALLSAAIQCYDSESSQQIREICEKREHSDEATLRRVKITRSQQDSVSTQRVFGTVWPLSLSELCEQSEIQTVVRMDQPLQSMLLIACVGVIPLRAVVESAKR